MTAIENKKEFLAKLVDGKGDLSDIVIAIKKLSKLAEKTMKFGKDTNYVNRVINILDDAENRLIHLKDYIQKAPADKLFKP